MLSDSPKTESEEVPSDYGNAPINLGSIWRIILRRRWVLISALLVVMAAVVFVTLRQQKIYVATATLIIDLAAPKVLDNNQVGEVVDSGSGSYWFSREYYETQYKVISSRAVASRVVAKLHLASDLRFLQLDKIEDAGAREKKRQGMDPIPIAQSILRVEPIKESRMVLVQIEYPDPIQAAALANAFAEEYIAENLSVRLSTTNSASEWLESQLVDLEAKVDKSMRELYKFKKEKDIVSTSFENKQSMVSQRLVAFNDALTKARIQKAQLQGRAESIRALRNDPEGLLRSGDAFNQMIDKFVVQQMKLRLLEVTNECADLKSRYLGEHPKLSSCLERLSLVKANLMHEIEVNLAALEKEYREVAQSERNLLALYNEAKDEAFKVNQFEEEYQQLKRTLDNNERLYEVVLKRLKDAGLSGRMQMSNVRILDRAKPADRPIRPKPLFNLAFGVLCGLVAGLGLVVVLEYLDTSITTQQQVEERLRLAFLGIIPKITAGKGVGPQELAIHAQPRSAVAECCRSIRTNLLFMSPDRPFKSILLTSSGPGEGKTTASVSLAVTMAEGGSRVLLLDADMRRPRTHKVLGVSNEVGLSSLIVGAARLEDVIKSTGIPGLSLLVCGPVPPNPTNLLQAGAFSSLLSELGKQYDRIVIDSPPVGAFADAAVISTLVDGTLLILKAGKTSSDHARRAIWALRNVKARIFGAVLNDLDLEDRHYGYYYYNRHGYYYNRKTDEAPT